MKRIFLLIAAFICFFSVKAQEAIIEPADTTAKAKIVFENVVHDFANIKVGSDGTCVFKFKNEGTIPLVITRVAASCGCTTPSWTREPVLPGISGEIKVKYDTNRMGTFSKSITVVSNAETSSVLLKITGNVQ